MTAVAGRERENSTTTTVAVAATTKGLYCRTPEDEGVGKRGLARIAPEVCALMHCKASIKLFFGAE